MKPRIFICIEGGSIQSIVSDQPTDIMVLDCDTEEISKVETYKEVEINKDRIESVFNPPAPENSDPLCTCDLMDNNKTCKHCIEEMKKAGLDVDYFDKSGNTDF